jgi:hypothetical protein
MNSDLPANIQKYLRKYGSDKWEIQTKGRDKFDCAVIVPAIAEYDNLILLLNSLAENILDEEFNVIIIFTINNLSSSSQQIKDDNLITLKLLQAIFNNHTAYHPVVSKFNASGLHIGFIDASSEGFEMPEKTGGVGLARKIGMDSALTIFNYTKPVKKILICLDADCIVDNNYIREIIDSFNWEKFNAAVISYEHLIPEDEENAKAIICYEIFLRYYELGLKYAGSQYAFQTVGSAMACDDEAYIKVEGMNKQKAAEDFYFLEKLAKQYQIKKITPIKVFPSPRKSWRVPFGTGQRINRYYSGAQDEYLLYNPAGFDILKKWLKLFHSEKELPAEDYLQKANEIHQELCNFLTEQNFKKNWDRILSNSKDKRQISLQKVRWFDGFKTLKLIHHLRDSAFPLIKMFDALDIMFDHFSLKTAKKRTGDIPDLQIQKEYLFTLRSFLTYDN